MKNQIIAGVVICCFGIAGIFLGPMVVVLLQLVGFQVTMMREALVIYIAVTFIFILIGFKLGLRIIKD